MTQSVQTFWDKQARRYDNSEKQFAAVYTDILAKTSTYLNPDDHVLDFGCATGTKTIALASKVRHIHGLDISTGMIREAMKKKESAQIPNITFSQGTIFSPELKNGSFGKIIAYAFLQLLEDHENVIRRIHELLKPGGLFISLTTCFEEKMTFRVRLQVKATLLMKKLGLIPLHVNLFSIGDVENAMVTQGFTVIESEKIFHGMTACFIVVRKETT
ncbi:MAG TPA: class I SAM-dependent methyltransferase [Bacteroidales bacterium]|nr:class I SAM-dependent methyltransferase [Bacteroidales bacterium]